jgi:hypothetical protein
LLAGSPAVADVANAVSKKRDYFVSLAVKAERYDGNISKVPSDLGEFQTRLDMFDESVRKFLDVAKREAV